MDGFVIAVNLWDFKPANGWICIICWILIAAFVLLGIAKLVLNHMCIDNGKNHITISSLLISIIAVLIFCNDKRDLLRCDSLSLVDDKGWVTFLCYCKMQYEGASGCLI